MAKRKASVGMAVVNAEELRGVLDQFDTLVRHKVMDRVLRAGTRPVASAMRANAPSSAATGSRRKQSKKTRARFANSKPLKTTIRAVVRKGERRSIALVGPSYTHGGGHGNFFASDHKRKVLWGRQTGAPRKMNQFVKATADQTSGAATAAMIAAAKKELEEAARQAAGRGNA